MGWTDSVDLYCERLGPGFWAEPINALSNAGFIGVGLYFLAKARREGADGFTQILCLWVVAIGVGSFLFHTFANRWSGLADVLPIWSFVVVYVGFTMRRFLGLTAWRVALGYVALGVIIAALVRLIPAGASEATNGSVQYLPAVLVLIIFVGALARAHCSAWRPLLASSVVFGVSLFLRTIDMRVCSALPWGTHWAWHSLNAVTLALLLSAAVRYGRGAEAIR